MKKAAVLSILVAVVSLALEVTGEGQQAKKVYRIGYLTGGGRLRPRLPPTMWLSAKAYENSVTSRARILSSSTEGQRVSSTECRSLQQN